MPAARRDRRSRSASNSSSRHRTPRLASKLLQSPVGTVIVAPFRNIDRDRAGTMMASASVVAGVVGTNRHQRAATTAHPRCRHGHVLRTDACPGERTQQAARRSAGPCARQRCDQPARCDRPDRPLEWPSAPIPASKPAPPPRMVPMEAPVPVASAQSRRSLSCPSRPGCGRGRWWSRLPGWRRGLRSRARTRRASRSITTLCAVS